MVSRRCRCNEHMGSGSAWLICAGAAALISDNGGAIARSAAHAGDISTCAASSLAACCVSLRRLIQTALARISASPAFISRASYNIYHHLRGKKVRRGSTGAQRGGSAARKVRCSSVSGYLLYPFLHLLPLLCSLCGRTSREGRKYMSLKHRMEENLGGRTRCALFV